MSWPSVGLAVRDHERDLKADARGLLRAAIGVAELGQGQLHDCEPTRQVPVELVKELYGSRVRFRRHLTGDRRHPTVGTSIHVHRIEPHRRYRYSPERAQAIL